MLSQRTSQETHHSLSLFTWRRVDWRARKSTEERELTMRRKREQPPTLLFFTSPSLHKHCSLSTMWVSGVYVSSTSLSFCSHPFHSAYISPPMHTRLTSSAMVSLAPPTVCIHPHTAALRREEFPCVQSHTHIRLSLSLSSHHAHAESDYQCIIFSIHFLKEQQKQSHISF